MDAKQLRELVKQTLQYLEPEIPYSDAAVELLLLTAAQESGLGRYLKQIKGPARGIYQIEPRTENDLLGWLETRHPALHAKLMGLNAPADDKLPGGDRDTIFNIAWSTALARCYYLRFWREEIPTDPAELAIIWKQKFNTALGRGTAAEALLSYRRHVLGVA